MNQPEINLNNIPPELDIDKTKRDLQRQNKKRGIFLIGKVLIIFLVVILTTGAVFAYKVLSVEKEIVETEQEENFIDQLKRLLLAEDKTIKNNNGRTNILLLGMGGEGHNGALLTDTIILASLDQQNKKVSLLSIPRDLYVKIPSEGYAKINSAYALGEATNGDTGGIETASSVVEEVTGQPIHYYVRIDFDGFQKIIDSLEGIDVYVPHSFYDPEYPTDDFGWQTISFTKGENHFNGEQALQYARSRHGIVLDDEGFESSDFARAKRQQDILLAIKDKALALETIINPAKISSLLDTLGENAKTNLKPWEMIYLYELSKNIDSSNIINKVLDDEEGGLLYPSTSSYGAYILLPNSEDYSEIHELVENIFSVSAIKEENAKIEIQNGTDTPGLAMKYATELEKANLNINKVGNYGGDKTFEKNVIYILTDENKNETIKYLKNTLAANITKDASVKSDPEGTVLTASNDEPDIIIVLGSSSIDNNPTDLSSVNENF